jgi:hypothetical protein
LANHEIVRKRFESIIQADREVEALIRGFEKLDDTSEAQADKLISELDGIPPGRDGWRQYEDICIKILNYAFIPPLRLPRIQSRSDDDLDRRDAVYPIGMGNAFWDSIKYEYSSRMVVAEFKNYVDPVGQGEVESLQQYLLPKAKRAFGLLCSRHPPSDPALKARRRAWMVSENIILFLEDDDLKEIVRIRAEDGDPSFVLEAQIDEFFIHLTP